MKTKNDKKYKYWYLTEVSICVLCGKETRVRKGVYTEEESGIGVTETACHSHF